MMQLSPRHVKMLNKGVINPLFTDTVTIYNHVSINRAETWHRTVIIGVQWADKHVNTTNDAGFSVLKHQTVVTIPITANSGRRIFVPPEEFKIMDDKAGAWTLNPANGDDVIVYGACDKEISQDYTITQLIKEHTAVSIMVVRDNTRPGILKNWKVECV